MFAKAGSHGSEFFQVVKYRRRTRSLEAVFSSVAARTPLRNPQKGVSHGIFVAAVEAAENKLQPPSSRDRDI
jgi:hypothetical protein